MWATPGRPSVSSPDWSEYSSRVRLREQVFLGLCVVVSSLLLIGVCVWLTLLLDANVYR